MSLNRVFGVCRYFVWGVLIAMTGLSGTACKSKSQSASSAERVEVQHILIGFDGSLPGKAVKRSKEEAETLAKTVLERAKKGESFEALVKEFSDDQVPGIYGMSNKGVAPQGAEFPREQMVPGFGDTAFALKEGEIGIANFDTKASPFGWHIIKRLK